ncbi:MAG: tRNA uridine-5-carboxymethylaminomethyl(34) synthesis GTPase MnmE [Spirochaetales bacterium]|nr:tRNA uridine-5-carboxymethylaminomethyl(34) synthesis GTPase MnmE [Spirochaetales bacterium]
MKELTYNQDDLICALATGWGASALGVIRTSGIGAIEAVSRIFSRPEVLNEAPGHTLVYGYIIDADSGKQIDQVMAAVFRAPRSYTGEESVELSCHGGVPGLKAVLEALNKAGFRDAGPGEFTMRGFVNGKLDLTRAEAVHEIVTARTGRAHDLALHRLSGAVETQINLVKGSLVRIMSALELQLDYPEDEVGDEILPLPEEAGAVRAKVEDLIATFRAGRLYQDGIRIVLTGATNAGKSSLFNLFLKEERSIVSEIHGTTRDYIESWVSMDGIPVSLYDTAGLRDADNPVELEGIRRSSDVVSAAHLVLYIVDGQAGAREDELERIKTGNGEILYIWNKIDLSSEPPPEGVFPISALTGEGFGALEDEILMRVRGGLSIGELSGSAVIDSRRQRDLLMRTSEALVHVEEGLSLNAPLDVIAVDVREALDCLGEITGDVTSADILDTMFSSFCVGK